MKEERRSSLEGPSSIGPNSGTVPQAHLGKREWSAHMDFPERLNTVLN